MNNTNEQIQGSVSGSSERRKGVPPIPLNLRSFLNEDQRQTLKQIESFGWALAFVRRPLFQEPLAVVSSPDLSSFSILEVNGDLIENPDIIIRH